MKLIPLLSRLPFSGYAHTELMTPEALICTSDFELSHMVRLAAERFGITVGIALSPTDALQHLERNKFDLVVVDCSELESGCAALHKMRLNPTHRSAVAIAVVVDRDHAKYVCDSGANFVIAHAHYETEIVATLRSAYGLVLRERGRYNRFVLDAEVHVHTGDQRMIGRILNLSQGGVCVVGMSQRISGRVQLRFALEEGKPELQVTGNVAWQREQRLGVQFTNMSKANRNDLDAWLARQFEIQARTQLPSISAGLREDFALPDSSRTAVYGNEEGIQDRKSTR